MRRAAKVDNNHAEIVRAMRDIGASVQSLAPVGKGCPDILIGWRGRNILLEIKDGTRPCDQKLTVDQVKWHENWPGQVAVVGSVRDAVDAVIRIWEAK